MSTDPLVHDFISSDDESGAPRQRARRRADSVKKQVSVPGELWEHLTRSAERVGSTPNDLLVRLAARAAADVERAAASTRIAEARWQAFTAGEPSSPVVAVPLAQELVDAAESFGQEFDVR